MKGDFSRDTFDRKKHYISVLKQQGRLEVDADSNEQRAIDQNRTETEAIDVIGKCGAPKYNGGFGITATDGQFRISAGRYYVDGILCENEEDVLYSEQPDLPNPPDLIDLFSEADTGTGIIYLKAWKHHLTALDDPQIREVALGGPDTSTRVKVIWQVQVLPISESLDELGCDTELSEWEDLIAPSTGTLNARTVVPEGTDNPCLIPPNAGYVRLENQLYRVEIHQGGDSNTEVTFKWSRDNGSVVTEIKKIDGEEVTVADLGPDDVLGFAKGQWIEIIDDALQLNGQPGELLEIDDFRTDAEGRPVIVLASAATPLASGPGFPNGINPDYHPKLRRWDGGNTNGIPISEDWIPLEGGIEVQFSDDSYKTGDYWLIPARTATGQIEWAMTNEPSPVPIPQLPLGIKYHCCRLAIADFAPSDDPDDDNNEGTLNILQLCVLSFPPLTEIDPGECCCTIVVQPGEDIQAALDSLPPAGGCICLKTGIHEIRQPIRIEQSNLVLKGESPGTRVVRNNGTNLLIIAQPRNRLINDVVVEQIRFEAAGVDSDASELLDFVLIMVSNCLNVEIHHCRFEVAQEQQGITAGSKLPITPALGIAVVNSRQITLLDNTLLLTVIGIWAEGSTACDFSRNHIVGPILQLTDRLAVPAGYAGMLLNLFPSQDLLLEGDFLITDNLIQDFLLGIVAGVNSDRCKIINNQILREAVNQLPIEDFNNQFLAGSETYIYGIITYSANCSIAGNYLELNSPSYGGIRAFGNFTCIENNILQSSLTRELLSNSSQPPLSIFLGQISDNDDQLPALGLNGSVVKDNKLRGSLTGIGAVNVEGVEISENQIEISALVASLSIGIALASTHDSIVRSNQIRGTNMGIFLLGDPPSEGIYNRIINNHISDGNYGIGALSETALIVSGNQIENMTVAGFAAGNLIESACLTHNQIEHCGYQSPTEVGAGVFIVSVLGNLTLESCQIKNIGISRQGEVVSEKTFWGIAVGFVLACEIRNNEVYYSDIINLNKIALNRIHRALLIVGWIGSLSPDIPYPLAGNALVTNNVFQGIGFPHLVEFVKNVSVLQAGFEQVDFSHNQCFHLRTQANPPPIAIIPINIRQVNSTVATWGRNIVVMGNQVKADNSNLPSIDLSNPESVTLMGNIATGSILNFGTGIIPANPENFNVFP